MPGPPPPGCTGGFLPPIQPPIGPVLRGADGEAFRRLVWLLLLLIAALLIVFGVPVPIPPA